MRCPSRQLMMKVSGNSCQRFFSEHQSGLTELSSWGSRVLGAGYGRASTNRLQLTVCPKSVALCVSTDQGRRTGRERSESPVPSTEALGLLARLGSGYLARSV